MVDNGDVRAFYDDLSADYHRMFPDWEASSRRQGAVLSALLADVLGRGTVDILDCACGIGTQLIGLAVLGHRLSGSDLSSAAVERARVECALAGVEADLRAADMRDLPFSDQEFDAVICADNSLPHLLTEAEVLAALGQLHRVLRPGGVAIVTTRDYDSTRVERPVVTPVQRSVDDAGLRSVTTQLWDWHENGDSYSLTHLTTRETTSGRWVTASRQTDYRAWSRQELSDLAGRSGLQDAQWRFPHETGFFQPLMIARRPT